MDFKLNSLRPETPVRLLQNSVKFASASQVVALELRVRAYGASRGLRSKRREPARRMRRRTSPTASQQRRALVPSEKPRRPLQSDCRSQQRFGTLLLRCFKKIVWLIRRHMKLDVKKIDRCAAGCTLYSATPQLWFCWQSTAAACQDFITWRCLDRPRA